MATSTFKLLACLPELLSDFRRFQAEVAAGNIGVEALVNDIVDDSRALGIPVSRADAQMVAVLAGVAVAIWDGTCGDPQDVTVEQIAERLSAARESYPGSVPWDPSDDEQLANAMLVAVRLLRARPSCAVD